jgi:CrcB protein
MEKALLFVGLGGGVGSIARYLISATLTRWLPGLFPWGTFVVNVAGCLLIGLLMGSLAKQQVLDEQNFKLLLVTGFCGGFTTFSAFAWENVKLIQSGEIPTALVYVGVSLVTSLLAVGLGVACVKP